MMTLKCEPTVGGFADAGLVLPVLVPEEWLGAESRKWVGSRNLY